jgi:YggT family protein
MNTILIPLLQVVNVALDLYKWVLIIWVVLSWLVAFGVVNTRNQIISTIGRALEALTEPVLRRIRRYVPSFGNVDISAVVAFLLILLIQLVIGRVIINLAS